MVAMQKHVLRIEKKYGYNAFWVAAGMHFGAWLWICAKLVSGEKFSAFLGPGLG